MITHINIGEIFMIFLLLSGSILTFITIRRMIRGQISLPNWAKWLLSIAMIAMLVITMLCILPPIEADSDDFCVTETSAMLTPDDSIPSEAAAHYWAAAFIPTL